MTTFTDKFVRGLRPAGQRYEERDGGCSGLILRVGKKGGKVWECVVSENGRRRRVRIGRYPDVSLAAARRRASEAKSAPAILTHGMRVADLWQVYAAEMAPARRAFRDVESVWTKWAEPALGRVRLEDLNLRHGAALIATVSKQSGPQRAAKCIRYLSPMLGFAVGRGLLPVNPWLGLRLPEGPAPRDRVLVRSEWRALWAWAQAERYPWGGFLSVLMLTGQRLGDVSAMAWAEIDDDGLWAIPAGRYKGKRRHEVVLTSRLRALVEAQPRHAPFVFSTREGVAVRPGSKLRDRIAHETGVSDWRFHDLRRTAATLMAEGGVSRFIIERVLGHQDNSVTAVYDRATYRDEKRRALEVLDKSVETE